MKKYIITICIIIALIIICVAGYLVYNATNMEITPETVKAKADQEIKYLDSQIVSMLNRFNNISYANYKIVETTIPSSDTNQQGGSNSSSESQGGGSSSSQSESQNTNEDTGSQNSGNEVIESTNVVPNSILTNKDKTIDWDQLKEEIEIMYATWPTVLIDLTSLNINGNELIQYTSTMDKVVKALEDQNKKEAIIQLSNLYNLLNTYLKGYSNDVTTIHVFQTKAYIVKAYALVEDDKWDEIKQNVTQAKNEYTNIVNNIQNTNNANSINKGYVLLNELEKNANEKNKDIFYINYKNVMQELETII